MFAFPPSRWTNQKVLMAATSVTVLLIAVVALQVSGPSAPVLFGEIPLPFASVPGGSLQGSLTQFGERNGIDVYDVTFNHDEPFEVLMPDRIYLVHVPNGDTVSNVPLDLALTLDGTENSHLVDYYGYRYSDAAATSERRDIAALRFSDRFPGQFFASKTAKDADAAHGNMLSTFAAANEITFRPTDGSAGSVRIDPAGALYVFIVNSEGGARLAVRGIASPCGNQIIEAPEQCDDGNTVDTDECKNDCTSGIPIPFGHSGTGTVVTQTGSTVTGTGSTTTGTGSTVSDPVCGNAETEEGEECDDGQLNGQTCDAVVNGTCTFCSASCGRQTVQATGNLFVSMSPTPIRTRQLLGGALGDEILRLHFQSENEPAEIFRLAFTATGPDASLASSQIDRLELYKLNEEEPFAFATTSNCGEESVLQHAFCASIDNQELMTELGMVTNVIVRPRMRSDTEGALSNSVFALSIDPVPAHNAIRARGAVTQNNLVLNDEDSVTEGEVFIGRTDAGPNILIDGQLNHVVLAKLFSITNASPDADGTAIPTGTQRPIGQFKFSAAAAANLKNGVNKWRLEDLLLTVDAPNVEFNTSEFRIYNKADSTQRVLCSLISEAEITPMVVQCRNMGIDAEMDTEIDPGSNVTFVLEATVLNAKVNSEEDSSIQVSLTGFSNPLETEISPSASHIHWTDVDNESAHQFFWIEHHETTVRSTRYGESGANPATCPNGIQELEEECDDGNDSEDDDCDNTCHLTIPTPTL